MPASSSEAHRTLDGRLDRPVRVAELRLRLRRREPGRQPRERHLLRVREPGKRERTGGRVRQANPRRPPPGGTRDDCKDLREAEVRAAEDVALAGPAALEREQVPARDVLDVDEVEPG